MKTGASQAAAPAPRPKPAAAVKSRRIETRKYQGRDGATLYVRLMEITEPSAAGPRIRYAVRWEMRELRAAPSGQRREVSETATASVHTSLPEARRALEAQCAEAARSWGPPVGLDIRTAQFRGVPALPPSRRRQDAGGES